MHRREFLLASGGFLMGAAALTAQASQPASRAVVILRDRTASFKRNLKPANDAILRAISAIGPGDTFLLIEVGGGGRFDPITQVREASAPTVLAELLATPANMQQFGNRTARLKAVWLETERARQSAREAVVRPVSINVDETNVYSALDYAAGRLMKLEGERYLILMSDLIHDVEGLKTDLPPKEKYPFTGVRAKAMFVPWQGSAAAKRQMEAWQKWFTTAGAQSFEMLDEAQSLHAQVLPPSSVPSRVPSPFGSLLQ